MSETLFHGPSRRSPYSHSYGTSYLFRRPRNANDDSLGTRIWRLLRSHGCPQNAGTRP